MADDIPGNACDEDGHAVLAADKAWNVVVAVDIPGNPFQTLCGSTDILTQLSKLSSQDIL